MREMIIGDKEFRHYMDVRWGVDMLGQKGGKEGSTRAADGGLDPYYFWDPANPFKQSFFTHHDHNSVMAGDKGRLAFE